MHSAKPRSGAGRGWRGASALLLALLVLPMAGCEAFSFLSSMGGERIRAVYPLEDRPTLVMVEDPDGALGDPTLARVVATYTGHHLMQNEAVAVAISQDELAELAERSEEEFRRMPIDRIGQQVGAEQVVHVLIDRVELRSAPGVYRPTVALEVKVIDAAASRRLFPAVSRVEDRNAPPPGHRLQVQGVVNTPNMPSAGLEPAIMRQLAEQVGLEVAQLFYDYKKPEPGSRL